MPVGTKAVIATLGGDLGPCESRVLTQPQPRRALLLGIWPTGDGVPDGVAVEFSRGRLTNVLCADGHAETAYRSELPVGNFDNLNTFAQYPRFRWRMDQP